MDSQQLAEIRARRDATTPGKWYRVDHFIWASGSPYEGPIAQTASDECGDIDHITENAEFAAQAHQDVPALLDYIGYLEHERSSLHSVCAWYRQNQQKLERRIDSLENSLSDSEYHVRQLQKELVRVCQHDKHPTEHYTFDPDIDYGLMLRRVREEANE